MTTAHNLQELIARRRELRQSATEEENILWEKLRNSQLGFKFRRQHSFGGYVLDFYCSSQRLIVEIDGGYHETRASKEYDAIRDTYFKELDYRVLRFKNEEVKTNMKYVLQSIRTALTSVPLS